jgi:hypothetical protein
LNFFARKVFQHKANSLVLNIQKRPILPGDRRPLGMKVIRWVLRPDLFPNVLERVNLPHFCHRAYLKELTAKIRLSYPMVAYSNISVDHREDKVYREERLEQKLKRIYY